jgi:hypothetical protein
MDLISPLDIVAGVSAMMLVGVFSRSLVALFAKLWTLAMTSPIVQSLMNTTLVALKATEDVWRPVLNSTAVLLKPIASMTLQLLNPVGSSALVILDQVAKGLVILGYVTTVVLLDIARGLRKVFSWLQGTGISIQAAVGNAAMALKDLATSMVTLTKAAGYIASRVLYGATYVVDSFDRVGTFLHTVLFESHKLTWDDLYTVSIPFLVVSCIVAYCLMRTYRSFACFRPTVSDKKSMFDIVAPRRSSRLARKRAMLSSDDLGFDFASCKKTAFSTTNL